MCGAALTQQVHEIQHASSNLGGVIRWKSIPRVFLGAREALTPLAEARHVRLLLARATMNDRAVLGAP